MKQVIVIKLEPSPEQYQLLLKTVEAFNAGCQHVADVAYENRLANKIALQKIVYSDLRKVYGLSAQMACCAIAKAVDAYKRDKRIHVRFDPHGAMIYDRRILSFKGLTHVSLLCLGGRELIPMRYGAYQAARIDRAKGQADLILREGVFYLYVTIDLPEAPPSDTSNGVLGIDLGIVEIATDSEGNSYSGSAVKAVRRRVRKHRRNVQACRTRSAYKRLQQGRRKQSRFVRNVNHIVSKQLVQQALLSHKALGLEDLSGIRERANGFGRESRWLFGNWAFDQLGQFVSYKASALGIPVVYVDPRNTSRMCSGCGHCDKANRKSQAAFECLSCGLMLNADFNAALNIKARAEVMPPIVPHASVRGTSPSL